MAVLSMSDEELRRLQNGVSLFCRWPSWKLKLWTAFDGGELPISRTPKSD